MDVCAGCFIKCPTKKGILGQHRLKVYNYTFERLLRLDLEQCTGNFHAFVEKQAEEQPLS